MRETEPGFLPSLALRPPRPWPLAYSLLARQSGVGEVLPLRIGVPPQLPPRSFHQALGLPLEQGLPGPFLPLPSVGLAACKGCEPSCVGLPPASQPDGELPLGQAGPPFKALITPPSPAPSFYRPPGTSLEASPCTSAGPGAGSCNLPLLPEAWIGPASPRI